MIRIAVCLGFLACFAVVVTAQDLVTAPPEIVTEEAPTPPGTYGTSGLVAVTAGGVAFTPRIAGVEAVYDTFGHVYANAPGTNQLWAMVQVPSGAQIERMEIYYKDSNATENLRVEALSQGQGFSQFFIAGLASTGSSGVVGTLASIDLSTPFQVSNTSGRHIFLIAQFPAIDATLSLQSAVLYYRLNVSAAPGTASFPNDVPTTHPFFRFIEALAAAGITSGCAPGSFCPEAPVTRGQMAVFLSAALGLHFTP